jgi:hypothetical protein
VELRRLGTSGLRVSALSLGAMTFGAGAQTIMKGVTSSDEEATARLIAARPKRLFGSVGGAPRGPRKAEIRTHYPVL